MLAELENQVLSRYIVRSAILPGGEARRIVYSTRTQRACVIPDSIFLAAASGRISDIPDSIRSVMISAKLLVPVSENEVVQVINFSRASANDSDVLYECIQPTSWCNFGCGYCGQEHSRKWMSVEEQSRLVERLKSKLASGRYKTLRIGWFGAEPLMGFPVIRSLSKAMLLLASEYGVSYVAELTTNGYSLTQGRAEELILTLGVKRVEITIDASPEQHNLRRPLRNGAGTFDRVWKNLGALLEVANEETTVALRCNVDSHNADDVPLLITAVAALEGRKPSLYFAPVHDWANSASKNSLSREEYGRREVDWLTLMLSYGLPVSLLPKPKPVVCMAINPHSSLVEADGVTRKCTEIALLPKHVAVPEYDFDGFLVTVADGKIQCSKCEMLPVCGGGCPKSWYDGKVPCPSAKINLPDRLLLAYAASAFR